MKGNQASFEKHLKKAGVPDELAARIAGVSYPESDDEKQDNANYWAAALTQCNELLDADVLEEVMFSRACCKSGFRLENARMIAGEYGDKSLEEKLTLLGQQKWMGNPRLNEDGDIFTGYCAGGSGEGALHCSCWRIGDKHPVDGRMPRSYCLCCAGHFRFHYQKATGLKLHVKEIVSSVFDDPPDFCSFLFEIVGEMPRRRKRS